MSVPVPLLSADALDVEEARLRPQALRRRLYVVSTVVVVLAIGAVPYPMSAVPDEVHAGMARLAEEVEALSAEDQALAARQAALQASDRSRDEEALRWLAPCDVMSLRNDLVAVARACGLTLDAVRVEEGLDLLSGGQEAEEGEDGSLLVAARFSLSGEGPLSAVLLFAGLLRDLPMPLRLHALELSPAGPRGGFTLEADRLSCPPLDEPAGSGADSGPEEEP